jgi:hypothetical protein
MQNITFSNRLKRFFFCLLVVSIASISNFSIYSQGSPDTLDGYYCPGPGEIDDEYASAFTYTPPGGATGTCAILQVWALVDYGNGSGGSVRLGFKNGNSGTALFRIYLDTDNDSSSGLLTDDFGGEIIAVDGAELILQINANNGATSFFEPDPNDLSQSTIIPYSGDPLNISGDNGSSDGCSGTDGQFFEFDIALELLGGDLCEDATVINIGHYASVAGGSPGSNLCISADLDFDINITGVVTPDQTLCEGEAPGLLTLELAGEGSIVENWEVSENGGTTWIPFANETIYWTPPSNLPVGTYLYRAVLSNEDICPGDTFVTSSATITVYPLPTAVAENSGPLCCLTDILVNSCC